MSPGYLHYVGACVVLDGQGAAIHARSEQNGSSAPERPLHVPNKLVSPLVIRVPTPHVHALGGAPGAHWS